MGNEDRGQGSRARSRARSRASVEGKVKCLRIEQAKRETAIYKSLVGMLNGGYILYWGLFISMGGDFREQGRQTGKLSSISLSSLLSSCVFILLVVVVVVLVTA